MRAQYAAIEKSLDEEVYTIREGTEPKEELYSEYQRVPSELLKTGSGFSMYSYIFDLDTEVLTMDFSLHWRMDRIPRADDAWMRAICKSSYLGVMTFDPDICSADCLASVALPLRDDDGAVHGAGAVVACEPRARLGEGGMVWRALVAAEIVARHSESVTHFGCQWQPEARPFRELSFALLSAAAGLVRFVSFRRGPGAGRDCSPVFCETDSCRNRHLRNTPGWITEDWFGGAKEAVVPEFGSLAHQPGLAPGAAPPDTTYWLSDDVLIHLSLVVDGAAVSKAMHWGLQRLRSPERGGPFHFYIVVLSLFDVMLAEVALPPEDACAGEPLPAVRRTRALPLSPLRRALSLSAHPREWPPSKTDTQEDILPHTYILMRSHEHSLDDLHDTFSGIAALVNFFDAVDRRRAAQYGRSSGRLPVELYSAILELVDYDTWQNCLSVSSTFRYLCMTRYRLDERTAIVGGPSTALHPRRGEDLMVFRFEDLATGALTRGMRMRDFEHRAVYSWMPVVGSGDRRAVMLDVNLTFELAPEPEAAKKTLRS